MKTCLLAALLCGIAASHMITGIVENKNARNLDYSSTRIILNSGQYIGFVDNMGSFNM